jgi:hypothetical protein
MGIDLPVGIASIFGSVRKRIRKILIYSFFAENATMQNMGGLLRSVMVRQECNIQTNSYFNIGVVVAARKAFQ